MCSPSATTTRCTLWRSITARASPTGSDGRTLTRLKLANSPTGNWSSGVPCRMARCSAVAVKMPMRGGTLRLSRTSTFTVRSAWNRRTTETMSVLASTQCAGRTKASSTRAMLSDCSSCWLCRSDRALSLCDSSANSSAPKVALAAISSLTACFSSA